MVDSVELPSLAEQRSYHVDDLRRKRAKEDFINLGMKASVEKLFKLYRDELAPKYGRENVPSLHRPDLDRWAKEDEWYKALAERENNVTETKRRDYEAIRSLRFDDLHDLSEGAIAAIREMLTGSVSPKDYKAKVDVAFEVLDRIGLTSKKPVEAAAPETPLIQFPSNDASDNDMNDFLLHLRGKKA